MKHKQRETVISTSDKKEGGWRAKNSAKIILKNNKIEYEGESTLKSKFHQWNSSTHMCVGWTSLKSQ